MDGPVFRTRSMRPVTKKEVFETPLSTFWFDEDGTFWLVAKPNVALTEEALADTFSYVKTKTEAQNFCILGDITDISFPTTEARDLAGNEKPKFLKALAFVTNSVQDDRRCVFETEKTTYPIKLFKNEQNAREWLKKFL